MGDPGLAWRASPGEPWEWAAGDCGRRAPEWVDNASTLRGEKKKREKIEERDITSYIH